MRHLAHAALFVIALWIGSIVGGCFMTNTCSCPSLDGPATGSWVISSSLQRPNLVGATVEITNERVIIRFLDQHVTYKRTTR